MRMKRKRKKKMEKTMRMMKKRRMKNLKKNLKNLKDPPKKKSFATRRSHHLALFFDPKVSFGLLPAIS